MQRMECIPRKRTMNLLWAPYSFNTFSPSSLFHFAHSLCVWDDVSLCHIHKVRHNQHYFNVSTHSHPPPSTNSSNVTPQGMDVFFFPSIIPCHSIGQRSLVNLKENCDPGDWECFQGTDMSSCTQEKKMRMLDNRRAWCSLFSGHFLTSKQQQLS